MPEVAIQTDPQIDMDLRELDPTLIGRSVRALSPKSQSRVMVEATAKIGMFGTRFISDQPGRPSVEVHPYPWTAAGASVIPVLRTTDQKCYFALVHNRRRDGDKKVYRLSEGFMNPKGCPDLNDGLPNALDLNDQAEEKIAFQGMDHVQAYSEHPAGQRATSDKDLFDTAIRELKEETSITISRHKLKCLGHKESDGNVHCIAHYFLANLNQQHETFSEPPFLNSSDPSEIDEILWVEPKNVSRKGSQYFFGDAEILPVYADMINHAISEIRRQELTSAANKELSGEDDLYDLLNPFLECDQLEERLPKREAGANPQFGEEACLRHQQFLKLAKLYRERIQGKKASTIGLITEEEINNIVERPQMSLSLR